MAARTLSAGLLPLARLLLMTAASLAGCVLLAADPVRLPQQHAWQVSLRDYLADLGEADVAMADHRFACPDDYVRQDDERIYRDWIVLGHLGREPARAGFQADPKFFCLDQIEGDAIRIFPEPAALAWWTQFDFPGNPYSGSIPGMRRALVIAIVDMIMLETAQDADPRNLKPDFMGANIGTWAYTFHHAHPLLPAPIQQAYRQGMLHYLKKMERLAPRDGNTNMDMREIATLAELDQIFGDDPAMHRRLTDDARRILFGDAHRDATTSDPRRGTFHPAGYIGEADGPETSYNGISLFHLAEAAMISRGNSQWDAFLPEVIERMVRFKALNTFPQPDGSYEGPSSWAKRTNDPYPRDQRDRPWRSFAEAMLTDQALYRLRVDPATYTGRSWGFADRATMLADIRQGVERLNRNGRQPEKWNAQQPPVWQEGHWPDDLPYTWDHYVPGSYARFAQLVEQRSPLLLPPLQRTEDLQQNLDGEFWVVKRGDWAFQVEAVPHMGRSYDVDGSGALAGGSLATFWTRPTGVIVLGRLPNKWNYVTWDTVAAWPTHHVWGRTADGSAFSSARQRDPWVHFDTDATPPQVHVFGGLGMNRTVQKAGIIDESHVFYRRSFTQADAGLRVHSELLSLGDDLVTELWETLPIYLSEARPRGAKAPDGDPTQIQLLVDGRWQPAGGQLVDQVAAVRAERFGHAVRIDFSQPQRVRLSDVVETAYQKKDRLQNLQIDLLRGDGRAVPMPKHAQVAFTITPEQQR